MRTWIALVAGCVAALFSMAQGAGAVSLQPVGTFNEPIYMTSPPGDARLFVVERGGRIQVVHDGTTSQFLDIHDRISQMGEQGMLSMAFDPNYATNGLFYVFYTGTAAQDGVNGLGHVDEFHVSSNPNVADPASRRPVLTISRPNATSTDHNGGQLQFGRDGYLYISVGGETHDATAQNLALLNGKLLRIDPHGATPGAYSIPSDNPFASSGFARHEIWALGLRNPCRFSFDAGPVDVTVADVGGCAWEEIDLVPVPAIGRGGNFGWPACEGFLGSCPGTIPPGLRLTHTAIRAGTARMAARSSGATFTAGPRFPRWLGGTSTRTTVRASSAPSSSASRSREAIAPKARRALSIGRGRWVRTRAAISTSPTAMWWTSSSARHPPPLRPVRSTRHRRPASRRRRRRRRNSSAQPSRRRSTRSTRSTSRTARRSTRRRRRRSSRVILEAGPCLSTDARRATK